MRAAIVGSRTFNDYDALKKYIQKICEERDIDIDTIVSGGARGADTLAEQFADEFGLKKLIFKADWNKYGKRAGFIRNVDIIDNCDVCFAFWDGESHGTKHDVELCQEKNAKKKTKYILFIIFNYTMKKIFMALAVTLAFSLCSCQKEKETVIDEFVVSIGTKSSEPLVGTVWENEMVGEYNLYLSFERE